MYRRPTSCEENDIHLQDIK